MGDASAFVQLIVALVGGGTIASILNAILSRKKLGADATKVITEAAAGVATDLRADNADLRARLIAAEARIDELEDRDEVIDRDHRAQMTRLVEQHRREMAVLDQQAQTWRDVLQLHAAWDHMATMRLREAQVVDLPEPPPLYPPFRVGA